MRKTTAPEEWPPEAQELYRVFADKLAQRIVSHQGYLEYLGHFFRSQNKHGLTYLDFPKVFLDTYLKALTPHNSYNSLAPLKCWLRFLFARKKLLWPLHEELQSPWPRPKVRRIILSHEQVMRVLSLPELDDPLGLRDRALLEVAYATAMRTGELLALNLCDLDLAQGQLTVRQAKNTYQSIVPLTRWAQHFLARYLKEARPSLTSPLSLDALWLSRRGRPLGKTTPNARLRSFYEVKKTLGFSVSMHQLRHACATHLLMAGASLRRVQELLGHVDIGSTQIYTDITPTFLHEIHERCHPRNNGAFGPGL